MTRTQFGAAVAASILLASTLAASPASATSHTITVFQGIEGSILFSDYTDFSSMPAGVVPPSYTDGGMHLDDIAPAPFGPFAHYRHTASGVSSLPTLGYTEFTLQDGNDFSGLTVWLDQTTQQLAASIFYQVLFEDSSSLTGSFSGVQFGNSLPFTFEGSAPIQALRIQSGFNSQQSAFGAGATNVVVFQAVGAFRETQPTSAPEPAAWALLIAGFGIAGSALRRKHRAACA